MHKDATQIRAVQKKNPNKKIPKHSNKTSCTAKLSNLIGFAILAKIGIFHFSEMGKCILQTSLVFLIKRISFFKLIFK